MTDVKKWDYWWFKMQHSRSYNYHNLYTGILQSTTPMTSTPSSTTTSPSPTTTTTMTTTTTTMTTTTTTTQATTTASGGSGQLNLTALEQMKLDLTVDPKDTSGISLQFCISSLIYFPMNKNINFHHHHSRKEKKTYSTVKIVLCTT